MQQALSCRIYGLGVPSLLFNPGCKPSLVAAPLPSPVPTIVLRAGSPAHLPWFAVMPSSAAPSVQCLAWWAAVHLPAVMPTGTRASGVAFAGVG